MGNEKFKKACAREAQPVPPIWMMRQAGRYHEHYQALRKKHSFIELCKDSELAAEVALGPIEAFDFDVSILFSDLLFPLEALGMGLDYQPAPTLGWHLQDSADFKKMRSVEQAIEHLQFQGAAVAATRKRLPDDKSLIGFVGSPWTLFVYAVAGSHKGSMVPVKKRLELFPVFCEMIKPLMEANIRIQLQAGAEKVMVFDTAAGELSAQDFVKHLHPYLIQLSNTFPDQLGYYSKNTVREHLQGLWKAARFGGYGYDHRWSLNALYDSAPAGFVQGNFDQTLLFLPEKQFKTTLDEYLQPFLELSPEQRKGWVCGLGHGVLPETPEAHVRYFVQHVREVFAK
jgi:uroporphyrinogen decarboxylase